MTRIAAAGDWSQVRTAARAARRCLRFAAGFLLLLAAMASGDACYAQPVKGDASFAAAGGFGRLVLKLAEDVESDVVVAGMIVVIRFKQPVDIAVDKLADGAPDYISSARRDPDGSAIRLALARKLNVNAMAAGERLFVDLLPDTWAGAPPGLPQDVVRELSERARAAERALRAQRAATESKKRPPIRVRTSVQPTFVRYVFETPDDIGVSSALADQRLSVRFNAPLTFDLADAKLSAPPNVAAITQKIDGGTSVVELSLLGNVDVHSFREDKNYVVDIGFQQPDGTTLPKAEAQIPFAPDKGKLSPASSTLDKMAQPAGKKSAAKPKPGAAPKADDSHGTASGGHDSKPEAKAETRPAAASDAKTEVKAADETDHGAGAHNAPAQSADPAPRAETTQAKPVAHADTADAEQGTPIANPALVAKDPEPKPALAAKETKPVPKAAPVTQALPIEATRGGDGLRLKLSFASPTPAALFRRGDVVWLVMDSKAPLDTDPVRREGGTAVGDVSSVALEQGQAIRIRLNRPQLVSLRPEGSGSGRDWTLLLADSGQAPAPPLTAVRDISDPAKATVRIALTGAGQAHRLVDPDAGDTLTVVTALPPPRGFIKRQDFVEFSLLETNHGVAVLRNSDDVSIMVGADAVTITRPGGLTLSSAEVTPQRSVDAPAIRPFFNAERWSKDQAAPFQERLDELVNAASQAKGDQRQNVRLELARFYMARGLYPEAKGVLDLALSDTAAGREEPAVMIGHAAASAMMNRPSQTLKDIANPAIATSYDAVLWKAMALAKQGKWAEAREKFKSVEFAIADLPLDIQRVVLAVAMRASLEVKDYAGAASRSGDLDRVGIPPEMKPQMAMMRGWLDEALGRDKDALAKYQQAIDSPDRPAASEAKLREIVLRQKRDELDAEAALPELERLTVTWRGDELEVRAQRILARLYANQDKFSESMQAARIATKLQPNSEFAREAQDDARALFAQVFLGSKGDEMPPIEALATFYDFRELTPVGRRGDEMIRRLADRLVAVDLLDQAADLMQYQIDKRLEGAARAQVAAKLAMIHLMNRKPERAIAALRTTRISDLAGEVRQQRLLLEARAQSDVGRHDLALEIVANIGGREAIRLRSDIFWAARRWRESSEQVELYLGERWRDFKPLNANEKSDVLRALVGYSLAEDALGLARFREKFAPLMTDAADRAAFEIASQPSSGTGAELAAIAKMAAGVDTLDGFLREMKQRFPDASAKAIVPGADPTPTGSLPAIAGRKQVEAAR